MTVTIDTLQAKLGLFEFGGEPIEGKVPAPLPLQLAVVVLAPLLM